MAEMALGYGSEYQLLRFLGHHRNYLNKTISDVLKTNENINWLDYPKNSKRRSLDGEYKDIECFNIFGLSNYMAVENAWKNYWPQTGNSVNWDGIFRINDTWYFVEARAKEWESDTPCGAKNNNSIRIIKDAFTNVISYLNGIKAADHWVSNDCKSYQLAMHLAFIHFCGTVGIKAKLVYIDFLNGFNKPGTNGNMNVTSAAQWDNNWKQQCDDLGIDPQKLEDILYHVYIDCN